MRPEEVKEYLRHIGLEYEELQEADEEGSLEGRLRRLWKPVSETPQANQEHKEDDE